MSLMSLKARLLQIMEDGTKRLQINKLGYKISPKSPSNMFDEVLLDKIYDIEGFTPKSNDVVLDIGAWYGDSAIWWAKTFNAKVVAFEPLEDVYKEMLKNIILNKVSKQVSAVNSAIGSLILGEINQSHMLKIPTNPLVEYFPSKNLDAFSFDRVDLIKIDVEGFEMDVLVSAIETIKKFKPKIIIETHSKELRERCETFLHYLGYELQFEGNKRMSGEEGFDEVANLFLEYRGVE